MSSAPLTGVDARSALLPDDLTTVSDDGAVADRDLQMLGELLELRDPLGFLSFYSSPGSDRSCEVAVLDRVPALAKRLEARGHPAPVKALTRAVDRCRSLLPELLASSRDPREAVFLPLSTGEAIVVRLPIAVRGPVDLDINPYLRPMFAALDQSRPAGVVAVSAESARVVEVCPPHTREAARFDAAQGQSVARFLNSVGNRLARIASVRMWDAVILCGDDRLTKAVRHRMPADGLLDGLDVVRSPRQYGPSATSETVGRELLATTAGRHLRLVERVVDEAIAGGMAAVGLESTRLSVEDGRVARLVFDAQTERSAVARPLLARAVARGARMTPIDDDAAALLAPHDGVSAVLES